MSDSEAPDSPLTALDQETVRLHELYVSYMNAGFSEARAYGLVCLVLANSLEN